MELTYFTSKRFESPEEMRGLHAIRETYLPIYPQQTEEYKAFQTHSVRYTLEKKESHLEEHFVSLGGKRITFYHDSLDKEMDAEFIEKILSHYDYIYGGSIPKEQPREKSARELTERLLQDKSFTYEQETLVYERGENEIYLFFRFFDTINYGIHYLAKEEAETEQLEKLTHVLKKKLK